MHLWCVPLTGTGRVAVPLDQSFLAEDFSADLQSPQELTGTSGAPAGQEQCMWPGSQWLWERRGTVATGAVQAASGAGASAEAALLLTDSQTRNTDKANMRWSVLVDDTSAPSPPWGRRWRHRREALGAALRLLQGPRRRSFC